MSILLITILVLAYLAIGLIIAFLSLLFIHLDPQRFRKWTKIPSMASFLEMTLGIWIRDNGDIEHMHHGGIMLTMFVWPISIIVGMIEIPIRMICWVFCNIDRLFQTAFDKIITSIVRH